MMSLVALATAASGCSSGGDGSTGDRPGGGPLPSVSVPPERLTPFCEAMIELADRLETDPPDDAGPVILEAYLQIVDDVPPAIESEFRAVIAELQGDAPPTTTGTTSTTTSTTISTTTEPGSTAAPSVPGVEDFDAEGRLPGESPSERVSDYVLFACRDSDNNPGPPATEPLDDVVVVDDTAG